MVVGFCSVGCWCYSGWWVWDLRTLSRSTFEWEEQLRTVSGKCNENAESVQDFTFWFCVWCKSRELGGRVSRRFQDRDWSRALIWALVELCQVEGQPKVPPWLGVKGNIFKIVGNSGQLVPTLLSKYWWKHKQIRVRW